MRSVAMYSQQKQHCVQGSFGFLGGCLLMTFPILPQVWEGLIASWFGLCVGYLCGSCCFFLGSYATICHIGATTAI